MLRAGEMRHRVRLEQQSTSVDAAGQPLTTWSLFAERWAAIQRTPGGEVFASAQRGGRVPTVFRLRYLAGVTPAMRVVLGAKAYNILSAFDPSGLKEELVLTTEELVEVTP